MSGLCGSATKWKSTNREGLDSNLGAPQYFSCIVAYSLQLQKCLPFLRERRLGLKKNVLASTALEIGAGSEKCGPKCAWNSVEEGLGSEWIEFVNCSGWMPWIRIGDGRPIDDEIWTPDNSGKRLSGCGMANIWESLIRSRLRSCEKGIDDSTENSRDYTRFLRIQYNLYLMSYRASPSYYRFSRNGANGDSQCDIN